MVKIQNNTDMIQAYHPTDCYDVHQQNKPLPGVYPIQVDAQTTVNVSCLASGWTVFQSRGQYGNPTDYFFKGWSDYEAGFGEPGKIHTIYDYFFIPDKI